MCPLADLLEQCLPALDRRQRYDVHHDASAVKGAASGNKHQPAVIHRAPRGVPRRVPLAQLLSPFAFGRTHGPPPKPKVTGSSPVGDILSLLCLVGVVQGDARGSLRIDHDALSKAELAERGRDRVHREQLGNENLVVEASDGEQALELARHRHFDVAVLDLRMPGMSVLELLEMLRTVDPECQSIILTGEATLETAVQAMKLGAYDYLTKPFSLAELEMAVQRAYERRQLAKEIRSSW